MPLHPGSSKRVIAENIHEMVTSGHPHDQAVAAALHNAHPNGGKNMAEGGVTAGNPAQMDAGVKDASASDFLLPFLLGPSLKGIAEDIPAAVEGLGETGSITIGKAAPKMEEAAETAAPKVEAFIKGVQKSPNGNEVKIWGVRGDPDEISKLGYGSDPGSVPEHVLRDKGILPPEVNASNQPAPNAYAKGGYASPEKINKESSSTTPSPIFAEGGKVERSSLEHQVPNAMMARAMHDGGVWLQNLPIAGVEKATHVEGKQPTEDATSMTGTKHGYGMADGGKVSNFELQDGEKGKKDAEGDVHVNRESHMSVPIESKDTEFHLKSTPKAMDSHEVGKHYDIVQKGKLTSQEGDMERFKIKGDAKVKSPNGMESPVPMSKGGTVPHEAKMKEIYKAMGIKKYADGGVAASDQAVSGLPSAPNPSDPTFWDQIKAALSQVGTPIAGATNAITAPVQSAVAGATPAIQAAAPAVVSSLNNLTGANLPVPSAPATPAQAPAMPPTAPAVDQDFMDKLNAGTALTPPVTPTTKPVTGTPTPAMPNIGTIFNQDTSKLTQGVNPEDRQALAQQLQDRQHSLGSIIAEAVSGLGDALATKGGRDQHSLQNIFSMQKQQRDEALANFDKARQDRIEKLSLQTQMGDNALKQAAAADAYGVDENLNKLIGAPAGTMKKDLNTYFQLMSAQVAKQEKDADLYMKAHTQASTDIDNAQKNASVLGIKPSAAQLQASGAKLADQYYNRAKGNLLVKPSDGGPSQWIPAGNLAKAKQIDPNLQIVQ